MILTHCPLAHAKQSLKNYLKRAYHVRFLWNHTGMHANNLKSTLVQVMAWCHQATSHYPSQCWPRSLSPYNITKLNTNIIIHKYPLVIISDVTTVIMVMSDERQCISNHQQLNCLLNTLFRSMTKTPKLCITSGCMVDSPHKGPINVENIMMSCVVPTTCCFPQPLYPWIWNCFVSVAHLLVLWTSSSHISCCRHFSYFHFHTGHSALKKSSILFITKFAGVILCMHPANREGIAQNDLWGCCPMLSCINCTYFCFSILSGLHSRTGYSPYLRYQWRQWLHPSCPWSELCSCSQPSTAQPSAQPSTTHPHPQPSTQPRPRPRATVPADCSQPVAGPAHTAVPPAGLTHQPLHHHSKRELQQWR